MTANLPFSFPRYPRPPRRLGDGFLKHQSAQRLHAPKHPSKSPSPRRRTYKELCVENAYIMDIEVDHKVVVEAKAIAKFSEADFAQLNSCLHFANFEVGLLINFHNWPLKDGGIKRLVNTKP
ncbi:GxxExxY protein [Geothrix sp. 21YS21S-2]|uniref:GxxExxY protein n=1 Tax=Geothrix sp. 21YS21S-2 TaxID=3068893 RepID=UPI0027BA1498|nr:GxxExxY protein [Geothrix sp. 21YS21S-2]